VTTRIEEQLRIVSQQLLSRPTLQAVVEEFHLYADPRAARVTDDVIEEMRDDVGLEVVDGEAFRVSYVAADPVLAARVTDRLSRLIIDEHAKGRTDFAVGVTSFLDTQLADVRAQLAGQEARLDEFRRRNAGALPTQVQANLSALANTQAQLQTLAQSTGADRDRLDLLQRLAAVPGSDGVTPVPVTDPLVVQLAEARATLSTLQERLTPKHPDVIRQRRVVSDLEKAVAARPAPSLPPQAAPRPAAPHSDEIASLTRRIAEKEAERQQLLQRLAGLQAKIDAAPAHEAEFATLSRDYDTLQKLYATLLTKSEEAKIAASLERRQVDRQFRLIDPARVPDRPFRPRRLRLLALGLLGSLGLAFLVAGVLEARDASIHDDADLRFVSDIRILGVVTEIVSEKQRARRRLAALALSLMAVLVAAAGLASWVWWWRR
jgi:polysaccharide chain length determinant protein (PEP-CTERM system associated)